MENHTTDENECNRYSDIYKAIVTNFFELNDFILYNYPDISRRGYSEQGVDVEVIPNLYKWHGISASYAMAIKDIREDLLRKSVYYRGSFKSFQKEFDPLLSLYKEILMDVNSSHGKLEIPLELIREFLLLMDEKFQTDNYFFYKLNEFCFDSRGKPLSSYLQHDFELFLKEQLQLKASDKQTQLHIPKNFFLGIEVKDKENNPLQNEIVKIYKQKKPEPKQLIDTATTNNLGVIGIKLQEGVYIAELEKYHLTHSLKLNWHSTITFIKPSFLLSVKVVDPDNKQIENIEIQISAINTIDEKFRTVFSKNHGNSITMVPMGNYSVEVKDFNLSKTCNLSQNCNVLFILPRISVKVLDPDNKQIENIKIQISSIDISKKVMTLTSKKNCNSAITVPMGNYLVEIKKYNLSKNCDLSQDSFQDAFVVFTLPRKNHWWQKY